jgi:hypothetical protein
MSDEVADWREGLPWSEEAEVFFRNVIGDKSQSPFHLVFDMARAMCERECIERVTKKWPYVGRVEPVDVATAITHTTGEAWSEEQIASWAR